MWNLFRQSPTKESPPEYWKTFTTRNKTHAEKEPQRQGISARKSRAPTKSPYLMKPSPPRHQRGRLANKSVRCIGPVPYPVLPRDGSSNRKIWLGRGLISSDIHRWRARAPFYPSLVPSRSRVCCPGTVYFRSRVHSSTARRGLLKRFMRAGAIAAIKGGRVF